VKFDFDTCYRAVSSRDARFDGMFFTAVTSTGIYCRPSCPAITPKRSNVRFFATSAAAQAAGFRACKRCRPDAAPGSPEWAVRTDIVARAMRLVADGVVDREGVPGLAARLHYSERQLHRLLTQEVGAGPLALARAHRAQTARILIETTSMPFSDIAFASGFSSIRQFNDTIREVFAVTPTWLRQKRNEHSAVLPGSISLRLPYRGPLDSSPLFVFLSARAVDGIEESDGGKYRRTLRLPRSTGIAELAPAEGHIHCTLRLADVRDLGAAVQRCRRLLDLDADPYAITESLSDDPNLAPLVKRSPGMRIPGSTDPEELAVRAVIGQQISVKGARTVLGRLVSQFGKPLTSADGGLSHVFPDAETLAQADLGHVGITANRQNTVRVLASALASGDVTLDPGADREETRSRLLELNGIGDWTASYVLMRGLGDPDSFMATDLGVRKALDRLGLAEPASTAAMRWKPWRSYAQQHLWNLDV